MDTKEKKYIEYWVKFAKHDVDVAITLFDNNKFDSCLYFCHLSIEILLKALWIKNNNSKIQQDKGNPFIEHIKENSLKIA